MNNGEGHLAGPRRPVLPSFSTRTLRHPSFMPLYMAAGFTHHHRYCVDQTVHPISPAEFFYTDPSMSCGSRIPNVVTDFEVFDCLQLNTPPPVMSACLAPPNRPDPFRASGPHPTRDLGCPEWRAQPVHSPVQPSRAIVQLTQEEDQAITNLLKLHHQDTGQSEETLNAAQMDFSGPAEPPVDSNPCLLPSHPQPIDSTSAEEVYKPCGSDVQYLKKAGSGSQLQQVRGWSDEELEAVDTLLSRFSLTEEDGIWGQRYQKPAATLPDPLPYQYNRDFPTSSETRQESEALPVLKATQSTQNDTGYNRFTCVGENGESGWGDLRFVEDRSARGDFPEAREQMISDLEGDAVHVLLSFGEMETSDILQ